MTACSCPQFQRRLADPDRLSRLDQQRALHALLVEVGAVGGAEVLDVPLAAAVGQSSVPRTGEVVGEHEGRVVGAADEDRLLTEGDLGAGKWGGGGEQRAGGARAPLPGV